MKKIVGILSAAAVLATSVFAADVAAKARITGSLFSYDTAKEELSVLKLDEHKAEDYNPILNFSYGDDKSGAAFKFYNGNDDAASIITDIAYSIWFKPIDALKITVGNWDSTLNQEHIGWWRSQSGIGSAGYTLTLTPIDGLGIDLTFAPNWNNAWVSQTGDDDAAVAELGFLLHYGADFGTISAEFDAKDTFKTLQFGAGYANTFDPVSLFVNVLGFYGNDSFNTVRAELYGEANIDAIGLKLFVPVDINLGNDVTVAVGATFRFDYNVNGYDIFVEIDDANLLADPFSMSIKPGVNFNVGAANIEAAVEIKAQEKIAVNVPLAFVVNF